MECCCSVVPGADGGMWDDFMLNDNRRKTSPFHERWTSSLPTIWVAVDGDSSILNNWGNQRSNCGRDEWQQGNCSRLQNERQVSITGVCWPCKKILSCGCHSRCKEATHCLLHHTVPLIICVNVGAMRGLSMQQPPEKSKVESVTCDLLTCSFKAEAVLLSLSTTPTCVCQLVTHLQIIFTERSDGQHSQWSIVHHSWCLNPMSDVATMHDCQIDC